jgi:nitrogen-specific signal transduction histidine kinase
VRDQRTYVARAAALQGRDDPGASVVMLLDVTAERARRDQAMQAEKMTALGELLSGVAHELNNPLGSVVGFSQLLLRQSGEDETRRRLQIIAEEAQRCRRIVQNLLDVARIQPPEKRPLDANELVESVLNLFAYQLRLDNVSVEWHPCPELPPVLGDRHQLQQMLVNLVTNAHHALKRVESGRMLRLRTGSDGGRVWIAVEDSGVGIPASHQRRIFDPFFTTKEPGVGTGLGLPIAAKIVREHGGQIQLRSEMGKGAEFRIDLPTADAGAPIAAAGEAPAGGIDGLRVLVVDDEQSFRMLLQEALEGEGCQVRAAGNGAEGVACIQEADFDCVISDLRMPVLDGIGLFHEACRLRPGIASRFLFITGEVLSAKDRRFLAECGAARLDKPFALQDLQRLLARLGGRGGGRGSTPVVDSAAWGPDEAQARAD